MLRMQQAEDDASAAVRICARPEPIGWARVQRCEAGRAAAVGIIWLRGSIRLYASNDAK